MATKLCWYCKKDSHGAWRCPKQLEDERKNREEEQRRNEEATATLMSIIAACV